MTGQLQEQGKDILCDRFCAVGGHVGDRNAAFACGVQIDDVVSGREDADIPDGGTLFKDIPAEHGFVGDDDFGVSDAGDNFSGQCMSVDGQIAQSGKPVPGEITGIEGFPVENDNAHGWTSFRNVSEYDRAGC